MILKIIHLCNGSIVKDLFHKYGDERSEIFKPSHLHLSSWINFNTNDLFIMHWEKLKSV
jgi:hypothetical protein